MENTDRLNLPYLMSAQAQKHVTHNEALRMLDALLHLSVTSRGASVPPSDPKESEAFLVGAKATAAWQGHDGEVAVFDASTDAGSVIRAGVCELGAPNWRLVGYRKFGC